MKKNYVLSLALVLSNLFVIAQVNSWEQTSTPPGGSVWGLTVINGSVFAAASNGGVYFSPDNGDTWIQRNGSVPQMQAQCIVSNGTDLYVGTAGSFSAHILKSSDYGLNWTDITPPALQNWADVRSLLIVGNDIYATTMTGNGIFKSSLTNISSSSWSNFDNGLPSNKDVFSMVAVGNDLVAGTYGQGVWTSPQNSANWTATSGNSGSHIRAVGANGNTVFAGTVSGNIYFSRSTDGGANWTPSNSSYFSNKYIYSILTQGNNIFVGIEYEGIRMSNDNGINWGTYNTGFQDSQNNWYCNHLNVRSMVFSGNMMFAGTDCGVWRTNCDVSIVPMNITNPTGIKEINVAGSISIYPNPANDQVIISNTNNYNVKIIDMLGKTVYTSSSIEKQLSIDVSVIGSKGIYFVQLINKEGKSVETKKLVVN